MVGWLVGWLVGLCCWLVFAAGWLFRCQLVFVTVWLLMLAGVLIAGFTREREHIKNTRFSLVDSVALLACEATVEPYCSLTFVGWLLMHVGPQIYDVA